MEHRSYTQKNRRGAFTLAEFLVVIAITMILAGVSFVAAIRYQSRLRRMEMDRTAKEIFLAAQNNLSLAKSGGIMERLLYQNDENAAGSGAGAAETETNASADKIGIALSKIAGDNGTDTDGLYYILYQPEEDADNPTGEIRERLLPFGSIDETVRSDGSYLIIYNPAAGAVREVWYSDRYVFQGNATEFTELTEIAGDPEKRERFHGEAVGYYAGDSLTEPGKKDPEQAADLKVTVYNKEILYVDVEENATLSGLKLWIEGVSSGAKGWIDLSGFSQDGRVITIGTGGVHFVILDDISMQGGRFADLRNDLNSSEGGNDIAFIPGEDIRIYAKAVTAGGNAAVSPVYQTNSLFQKVTDDKVVVSNIRHLENLDKRVSAFNPLADAQKIGLNSPAEQPGAYMVSQSEDMSWTEYRHAVVSEIHNSHASAIRVENDIPVYYKTARKQGSSTVEVWTKTELGCYAPLEPAFDLIYEGNTKKISDLLVKTTGAGGCFGAVTKNLTVENLIITRPNITSDDNAGGLIGYGKKESGAAVLNISVENVLVQYPVITSKGIKGGTMSIAVDAGALVGAFNGTTLTVKSAMAANTYRTRVSDAATIDQNPPVNAEAFKIEAETGAAGGLIGSVTGNVTLSGCVSSVYVDAYSFAGGLVANVNTPASGTPEVLIENSYVAAHTANGACLTDLYPGAEGFDTAKGRYNIVSTGELAGGLAAVLPAGSVVKRSYVTASVWSRGINSAEEAAMTAFVTKYGKMNSGETITGKKASDFSYCYSSSVVSGGENADGTVVVKGKDILDYSNTDKLEKYFAENASFTKKQAFPYDTTLESTYPMPTVLQLVQEDPETSGTIRSDEGEGSAQSKQIFKFARVHVGDWVKGKKETTADGLTANNGNRLWIDYVMDKSTATNPKYLTISIRGEISGKDKPNGEKGHVLYYLLDLQKNRYYLASSKEELYHWSDYGTPWRDISNDTSGRYEIEDVGTDKQKIRFYIDNLAKTHGRYQGLYGNLWDWNPEYLVAGENLEIKVCEEPREPTDSDKKTEVNSAFQSIEKIGTENGKDIYRAHISNGRHLENLGLCGEANHGIIITEAVQEDNILWQEDTDENPATRIKSETNTTPYCSEMKVYPENLVYTGQASYTNSDGFFPIDNENLRSYNGKGYTIVGLDLITLKNNGGVALFKKNSHLKVENLSLKDPVIDANSAAAVILQQAGSENASERAGSSLILDHIRVYGDHTQIKGGSNVGGIVAKADIDTLKMSNVYLYGQSLILGGNGGYSYIGGLIGVLNVYEELNITNCAFSGYLDGHLFSRASGGLIGYLSVADKLSGPGVDKSRILNCYVAGRNAAYGTGADDLNNGITITGQKLVGSFIGEGTGPLKMEQCFSTAGVYANQDYSRYGGLIGQYKGSSNLSLDQCYFAGKIKKSSFDEAHIFYGYLIGETDYSTHEVNYNWKPHIPELGTWSKVMFVRYNEDDGIKIIGSSSGDDWAGDKVTVCTFTDPESMKALQPYTTESGYENLQTIVYDANLQGQNYPYKIWTTENGVKTYRGDWIQ